MIALVIVGIVLRDAAAARIHPAISFSCPRISRGDRRTHPPVPIPLRPFLVHHVQLSPGLMRVRAHRDVISHRRDGGSGRGGGAAVTVAAAFDQPPNQQLEDVPGRDPAQAIRVTVHHLRPRRTLTSSTVRREHRWQSVVSASIEIFVFAIMRMSRRMNSQAFT